MCSIRSFLAELSLSRRAIARLSSSAVRGSGNKLLLDMYPRTKKAVFKNVNNPDKKSDKKNAPPISHNKVYVTKNLKVHGL